MGYYQTSYVGYGAPVLGWTYDMYDRLEKADLREYEGVDFLLAGPYDNDMLFLAIHIHECVLGESVNIDQGMMDSAFLWKVCIHRLASDFGMRLANEPCWFVVSDLS